MLKIILDQFLPTEVEILIDNYREIILNNVITAVREVPWDETGTIPVITQDHFMTIQIIKDGIELPIVRRYNKIFTFDISTNINPDFYCTYSLTFGYEDINEN